MLFFVHIHHILKKDLTRGAKNVAKLLVKSCLTFASKQCGSAGHTISKMDFKNLQLKT